MCVSVVHEPSSMYTYCHTECMFAVKLKIFEVVTSKPFLKIVLHF